MASDAEHEELLTPAECAALWKVDAKTITRWAKAGKLTCIRTLGGHRRYRKSEVMALLEPVEERAPDPMRAPVRTLWPANVTGPEAVTRNRLQALSVPTVGDLVGQSADDLRDLGLSAVQVDIVRLVLARKRLALYGDVLGEVA